ncbi:NUMOD4 motif [Kluyvera ascorbata]|nr:NUMOD4 motif [Kluyvera ascorbata]
MHSTPYIMEEEMAVWKKTQYENYEVSNEGEVRNTKTGNYLTKSRSKSNNYYKVTLTVYVNGKSNPFPIEIHRLVAQTFVPKPQTNERLVVDHIDDDKHNNNLSNLQWLTHNENILKAKRNKVQNPKLTQVQKDEIVHLYSTGMSCINITIYMNEKYGRSSQRQTYTKIAKGK